MWRHFSTRSRWPRTSYLTDLTGMSDLAFLWARFTPNGTNQGLFRSVLCSFWLGEPKWTEKTFFFKSQLYSIWCQSTLILARSDIPVMPLLDQIFPSFSTLVKQMRHDNILWPHQSMCKWPFQRDVIKTCVHDKFSVLTSFWLWHPSSDRRPKVGQFGTKLDQYGTF